jgi:hypothetical protein
MFIYFLKLVTAMLAVSSVILLFVGLEQTSIILICIATTFGVIIGIGDVTPDDTWANKDKDYRDEN